MTLAAAYPNIFERIRTHESPYEQRHRLKLFYVVDNLDQQGFTAAAIAELLDIDESYAQKVLGWIGGVRSRLADETLAKRFRHRDSGHRGRATRAGCEVEEVDLWKVWIRDEGVCHLCRLRVAPDDLDFDHVIPIARGGAHSADNVKVSHYRCNRSKGAKESPRR